jgi:hypothetical protein
MSRTCSFVLSLMIGWTISAAPSFAWAQDDALDRLLKKVEDSKSDSKSDSPKGEADRSKPGEVDSKDQALDGLLEKLSEPTDQPEAKGKASADAPPADPSKVAKGDVNLKPEEKPLDDRLEEILGRRNKKKRQDDDDQEGKSGPLAETIKKMREVERRLSQPDTGEKTRAEQEQIVKGLDELIERIRKGELKGQGGKVIRTVRQAGRRPGNGQGLSQNQGNTGGNAPYTKPAAPKPKTNTPGGKEIWGDLQAELRADVENVANEKPLPVKEMLIRRYYLSVSKKSLTRGNSE